MSELNSIHVKSHITRYEAIKHQLENLIKKSGFIRISTTSLKKVFDGTGTQRNLGKVLEQAL
jgi:hypothetical protein